MDKLKDRYFIRVKHKGRDIAERLPLANRQTLLRIFVHFLLGKINSIEVWNEEYFDRKVMGKKERINGKLVRKEGMTMREKVINEATISGGYIYNQLANKFREGLYDPEGKSGYKNETSRVSRFTEDQFEDAIELFTLINEGDY